ncbi:uncharacterized protein BO95DRAFT_429880 [Aspergillus brunneoviolaceus CBS 621.78]|uniref:Uncharacterized protein n=1 Tax=Aspergillus brunneoviolaceus CBS 621.78 TaxID=1450534 RepID=A0ACD1GF64_9EURO|nr:hypothetical protein BO95DRAFT_429880 [Aspergillus brunneoviolaceus CBS 621.78]RAH47827.1 hypothetical protein BO95DRAFT_429880 [Aspergillus brunneoviolaceus CBS 621.78]
MADPVAEHLALIWFGLGSAGPVNWLLCAVSNMLWKNTKGDIQYLFLPRAPYTSSRHPSHAMPGTLIYPHAIHPAQTICKIPIAILSEEHERKVPKRTKHNNPPPPSLIKPIQTPTLHRPILSSLSIRNRSRAEPLQDEVPLVWSLAGYTMLDQPDSTRRLAAKALQHIGDTGADDERYTPIYHSEQRAQCPRTMIRSQLQQKGHPDKL